MTLWTKSPREEIEPRISVGHSTYGFIIESIESLDNRCFTLVYLRRICGSANTTVCHRRAIPESTVADEAPKARESRCAIVFLLAGSLCERLYPHLHSAAQCTSPTRASVLNQRPTKMGYTRPRQRETIDPAKENSRRRDSGR